MNTRCAHGRLILLITVLALATLTCNLRSDSSDQTRRQAILDNPLIMLIAPVNGSVFAEGASVALYAVVQAAPVTVARIEFRVDDVPVGEVRSDQPEGQTMLEGTVLWTAAGQTGHLITAEAFQPNGASLGLSDAGIRVVGQPNPTLASAQPPPTSAEAGPATAPVQPTVEIIVPTNTAVILTGSVSGTLLNVRQGPGTNFPTLGTLTAGDPLQIIGRNADSTWWAITYNGGTAWVFGELIAIQGDTSQVPLMDGPAQ